MKCRFGSSLYLLFICWDFLVFHLFQVSNCSLKHFWWLLQTLVRLFWHLLHLGIRIYSLSFLIQVVIFLVLGKMSDFLLYFRQCWHDVVKLWIWFKSFVLAGLLWHLTGGGLGELQGKGESPSSPLRLRRQPWWCGYLITTGQGWKFSLPTGPPLTLSWVGGGGCFITFFPGALHLNHGRWAHHCSEVVMLLPLY